MNKVEEKNDKTKISKNISHLPLGVATAHKCNLYFQ